MINFNEEGKLLHLDNISFAYGDQVILKDISLEEFDIIRENSITGQKIAILGRSGTGKSTLFRLIAGLRKPKTGSIYIADTSSENEDDAKLVQEGDVGYVSQQSTLFRDRTAYQALSFALRKKDMIEDEKKALIDSYLLSWGLNSIRNKYPNQFSGGQRQRIAIIQQILSCGHFLVMDEPFRGLDVGNIKDTKNAFDKICNEHEYNTIIFSSHNVNLAVELADVIYVLGQPIVENKLQTYSTLIGKFDLRELGLAWKDFDTDHLKLAKSIEDLMLSY